MPTKKFNTENTESLIYENEILQLTVLGGIKLEGLDRMRATLKVELKNSSVPALRHNLDLYNDSQCEKLIRKTAERLEVGTSVIAASLAELTESLEEYRINEIKLKATEHQIQVKALSKDEQIQAEEFLRLPNLMERTNRQIRHDRRRNESLVNVFNLYI